MALEGNQLPLCQHRRGGWLPSDHENLMQWTRKQVQHVRANPQELNPVLQDFKAFIEGTAVTRQLFTLMFRQVPAKEPYNKDPTGKPEVKDYNEMLQVFNYLMTKGPGWLYTTDGQKGSVGFPFNAVLDWPMATVAGVAAFLQTDVNEQLRIILNTWAEYLASPASVSVLTSDADGWLSKEALGAMTEVAGMSFADAFVCEPGEPGYGYHSWDDFFTRTFKPGVRPVAYPDNSPVIANACESGTYRIVNDVKPHDQFWIKEQPYSLFEMLNNDQYAPQFVGGTIYQAFLSALSYHRWHSPVTGTVAKVVQIPGTYYAENYWEGFANPTGPDPSAPNNSQAYICEVATRALIFIQADDPRIGLMAVLEVGMAEVSSCEVFVKEGQKIKKGDEIGTFHFGGSTHCLIFRPEVQLKFITQGPPFPEANVKVCSALAVVVGDVKKDGTAVDILSRLQGSQ